MVREGVRRCSRRREEQVCQMQGEELIAAGRGMAGKGRNTGSHPGC